MIVCLYLYFYVFIYGCMFVYMVVCIYGCMFCILLFNFVSYVFLLLRMLCSVYSVFIVPTGTLRLT